MYIPPAFKDDDIDHIRAIIRDARLATLVTATPDGPVATPMPLFLDDSEGDHGVHGSCPRSAKRWRSLAVQRPT